MGAPTDEGLLERAQQADGVAKQVLSALRQDQGRAGHINLIVELRETIAQLERAMRTRSVIEQAKGIVMATRRCDADAAFEVLRRISQNQNQKLHDVADDLVARTVAGRGYRAPAPQ